MILGTCNFDKDYNGSIIKKDDIKDLLNAYYELSEERTLDTAVNYGNNKMDNLNYLLDINNDRFKLIVKVWTFEDIELLMPILKSGKIHNLMARNTTDNSVIEMIGEMKNQGYIKKTGISIYYPHELIQRANTISMPANQLFNSYFTTMLLYADVYIRSLYNMKIDIEKYINTIRDISEIYPKHKHMIKTIIGVDNIEQLKENIKMGL